MNKGASHQSFYALLPGGDIDIWTCGHYSAAGWWWVCDDVAVSDGYQLWAESGTDTPPDHTGQTTMAMFMSDQDEFKFALKDESEGIKKYMCEYGQFSD